MTFAVYVHKSEGGAHFENNIFMNNVRHGVVVTDSKNSIFRYNIVLGTQPRNATEPE